MKSSSRRRHPAWIVHGAYRTGRLLMKGKSMTLPFSNQYFSGTAGLTEGGWILQATELRCGMSLTYLGEDAHALRRRPWGARRRGALRQWRGRADLRAIFAAGRPARHRSPDASLRDGSGFDGLCPTSLAHRSPALGQQTLSDMGASGHEQARSIHGSRRSSGTIQRAQRSRFAVCSPTRILSREWPTFRRQRRHEREWWQTRPIILEFLAIWCGIRRQSSLSLRPIRA